MQRYFNNHGKGAPAPIFVAIAVFAMVIFMFGGAYAIEEGEFENGYEAEYEEEWYDPSDWFDEEGAEIENEGDWYESTYGYEAAEEDETFGYYEDETGTETEMFEEQFGEDEYDYYTEDGWFDEDGDLF